MSILKFLNSNKSKMLIIEEDIVVDIVVDIEEDRINAQLNNLLEIYKKSEFIPNNIIHPVLSTALPSN